MSSRNRKNEYLVTSYTIIYTTERDIQGLLKIIMRKQKRKSNDISEKTKCKIACALNFIRVPYTVYAGTLIIVSYAASCNPERKCEVKQGSLSNTYRSYTFLFVSPCQASWHMEIVLSNSWNQQKNTQRSKCHSFFNWKWNIKCWQETHFLDKQTAAPRIKTWIRSSGPKVRRPSAWFSMNSFFYRWNIGCRTFSMKSDGHKGCRCSFIFCSCRTIINFFQVDKLKARQDPAIILLVSIGIDEAR